MLDIFSNIAHEDSTEKRHPYISGQEKTVINYYNTTTGNKKLSVDED